MRKINSKSVIKLTNVTKEYVLDSGRHLITNIVSRKKKEIFTALNNINLEIKKGERVAIIGRNGSGKSTLLKVISGIVFPTTGEVSVTGRTMAIMDPEAGFQLDFTGVQNVYLNGSLLGIKKSEIAKKLDKIVKFADIGDFINRPLYTYSSGMKTRLGFAVAVNFRPNILVSDEFLGLSDANFRDKLDSHIDRMVKHDTTMVVATHWMNYIKKHSDRVIVLDHGSIVIDGSVNEVTKHLKKSKKRYIDLE